MFLSPRELDKLHVFMAAELARKRKERGLKLNHPGVTWSFRFNPYNSS